MTREVNVDLLRKENVSIDRPHPRDEDGKQVIYKFGNGYGVSVVRYRIKKDNPNVSFLLAMDVFGSLLGEDFSFCESHGYRHGLWEIGVLHFDGVDDNYGEFFESGFFDGKDVLGHLTEEQVNEYLEKIKNLNENDLSFQDVRC